MKISSITIVFLLVSLFQIGRTIAMFRKDRIAIKPAAFWIFTWLVIGFGSIFPETLEYLMRLAMMENRYMFIFVASIFVLFVLAYQQSASQKKSEQLLNKLVQEVALLNYKLERRGGGAPEKKNAED